MSILFNVLAVLKFFARHAACWKMKRKKGRKKKMSEWLTTWEMFSRLKDGEIAVSDDEKVRVRKFDCNSYYQVDREGNYLCQITLLTSFVERKWRIIPRYVSFEEAMKALMNGKTVWLWQGDEKVGYYIDKESGKLWAIAGDCTAPVEKIYFGEKWTIEE